MACCQIKAECIACREKAAIFNMSFAGKFYLTGPDAQTAADWIFTNNVDLKPGQLARFVYFTDIKACFNIAVCDLVELIQDSSVCLMKWIW
jgi:hypothetical protein